MGEPAKKEWESPAQAGITSAGVEVFCDDRDAFITHALQAGAKGSCDIHGHERSWKPIGREGLSSGSANPVGYRTSLRSLPEGSG